MRNRWFTALITVMKKFVKEKFLIYLVALLALIAVCSPNKHSGKFVFILLVLAILGMTLTYSIKLFQLFRRKQPILKSPRLHLGVAKQGQVHMNRMLVQNVSYEVFYYWRHYSTCCYNAPKSDKSEEIIIILVIRWYGLGLTVCLTALEAYYHYATNQIV